MENFRKLGDEEWKLHNRMTLTITPWEKPLLKDIIYLLQDFNSLYTRLVLISKGSYKAALTNPSYRRRFQALTSNEQLAIITIARGSLIKINFEGLGQCIDALRRLLEDIIEGPWWKWRHKRDMAKLEYKEKVVNILREIYKIDLGKAELDELAKALIPEIQRLAENPNRIEIISTEDDSIEKRGGLRG